MRQRRPYILYILSMTPGLHTDELTLVCLCWHVPLHIASMNEITLSTSNMLNSPSNLNNPDYLSITLTYISTSQLWHASADVSLPFPFWHPHPPGYAGSENRSCSGPLWRAMTMGMWTNVIVMQHQLLYQHSFVFDKSLVVHISFVIYHINLLDLYILVLLIRRPGVATWTQLPEP